MIVILKPNTPKNEVNELIDKITGYGVQVNPVFGQDLIILGLVGDTSKIDPTQIEANRNVEKVMHVAEPFKKANKMFHPQPTIVDVNGTKVGGKKLALMAGPCSVESEAQIVEVAKAVKQSGANFLRGGAFKPRTSPYAFQGLKYKGLELLKEAKAETGLPIVTEIMSPFDIDTFVRDVDVIQVGARNMQNFDLPGGNQQIILCERGIRTFETYTRNTLDLSAIVAVKQLSHLPIVVDPSHATGKWWMVEPLARAAIAVGADGLIVEVHNDPAHALCDGNQSIKPAVFDDLVGQIRQIAGVVGREV